MTTLPKSVEESSFHCACSSCASCRSTTFLPIPLIRFVVSSVFELCTVVGAAQLTSWRRHQQKATYETITPTTFGQYIGNHTINTTTSSYEVSVAGDGTAKVFRYCRQDFLASLSYLKYYFTRSSHSWMSPTQLMVTKVFAAVSIILIAIVAVFNLEQCVGDITTYWFGGYVSFLVG